MSAAAGLSSSSRKALVAEACYPAGRQKWPPVVLLVKHYNKEQEGSQICKNLCGHSWGVQEQVSFLLLKPAMRQLTCQFVGGLACELAQLH